jgi:thiol-disulfide isomerase/thioredoxin
MEDELARLGELVSPGARVDGVRDLRFRYLGLYFTARWCSACVRQAPVLKRIVERIEQTNPGVLKLITIRLDDSESTLGLSFWRFPRLTLPVAEALAQKLRMRYLPGVIVLNRDWKIVSSEGFNELLAH